MPKIRFYSDSNLDGFVTEMEKRGHTVLSYPEKGEVFVEHVSPAMEDYAHDWGGEIDQ